VNAAQQGAGPEDVDPSVPALSVLYHPDLERIGERALLRQLLHGGSVTLSRREPLFSAPGSVHEQPLRDRHLSRSPWELSADGGGVRLDPGSSPAQILAAGKPLTAPTIFSAAELENGVVLELAGRVVLLLHRHHLSAAAAPQRFDLVGDSSAVVRVRADVERVADLEVPVLLRGETGTGKELVATAIHRASRRQGAFLAINLAAIPASLASAELFGARKGAFTGASQTQPGYFARAEGGTLFLDEIGETPLEVQVQLLRVLETGEIQTLGAQQPRSVNVRLIAATDADLEARIAAGTFRSPLLHRLAGYEIRLPSLRSRRDDIGRLFLHFLRHELKTLDEADRFLAEDATQWLAPRLVARLAALDWPGNVRQLRNVVRQLAIGSRHLPKLEISVPIEALLSVQGGSETLTKPHTEEPLHEPQRSQKDQAIPPRLSRRKPATVGEEELRVVLHAQRWDLKSSAEQLQISRTSLYALIEKFPSLRVPKDVRNHEIRRVFVQCHGDHEAMVETLEISLRALRRRLREMDLA
jgi:DNA-binding NtrC family response regulator